MEELVLTEPIVKPEVTVPERVSSTYRVMAITLNLEAVSPSSGEPGFVHIVLRDNLNAPFTHTYEGQVATDMIKALNKANLTTKSMHKRILEKLSTDGVLPGTVTGAPDA
jgi:hypothetical protein